MISTSRLEIRPIEKNDIDLVFRLYANTDVCRYFDLLPFRERSHAETKVQVWLEGAQKGVQYRFALCAAGEAIGTCGLYAIAPHQRRASLGYDLLPEYWGNGYMNEALTAFLPYAANEFGIHRTQALVLPGHTASIKLLTKLRFEYEGLLRHYEIWEGRGYVDLEMYSRIQ